MNLLITVFGGMLLTVLLYGAGRRLRMSNFWAAVLACALPSAAYLVHATLVWPGLDVVTLHVIAYPTVAILLFQMFHSKAGAHGQTHWAPKLMIGFFVLLTILFGGFVHIAGHGLPPALARILLPGAEGKNIHTGFAGVVAHREDAAKVQGHRLGMEAKLARQGWNLEVAGLDALHPGRVGEVRVRVAGADGRGVEGVPVQILLGRPGQPPSQTLDLSDVGGGEYRTAARLPDAGVWLARLRLRAGEDYIELERILGGE